MLLCFSVTQKCCYIEKQFKKEEERGERNPFQQQSLTSQSAPSILRETSSGHYFLSLGEALRVSGLYKRLKKHQRAPLPWNGQLLHSSSHNFTANSQGLPPNNPKDNQDNSWDTSLMDLPCPWPWRFALPGQGSSELFVTSLRRDRTLLVSASFFLMGGNPMSHLLDNCLPLLVIWENVEHLSSICLEGKCKWQFFNSEYGEAGALSLCSWL